MLSTAMECVIRGRIPDVVLVPIAVSFDRVLEESLYAHELLGIPKPKESASGLFKGLCRCCCFVLGVDINFVVGADGVYP